MPWKGVPHVEAPKRARFKRNLNEKMRFLRQRVGTGKKDFFFLDSLGHFSKLSGLLGSPRAPRTPWVRKALWLGLGLLLNFLLFTNRILIARLWKPSFMVVFDLYEK